MVGPSDDEQFQIPVGNARSRTFPPIAHDTRGTREHRRLTGAQEHAGNDELPETPDRTREPLGQRPHQKPDAKQPARADPVGQGAPRKLAERVRPEEGGKQKAHIGNRETEVVAD